MPTPVGHVLAGIATHIATSPHDEIAYRRRAIVTLTAALLPDVDFLLRLVDGRNHHQGPSHSLGAAVLAGAVVLVLALARHWPHALGLGVGALLGWSSHVLLDYSNMDTNPPIGIMALWPLSRDYYKLPWPVFLDVGRTLEWRTVWHDGLAVAWEVVALSALVVLAWRVRMRRAHQ